MLWSYQLKKPIMCSFIKNYLIINVDTKSVKIKIKLSCRNQNIFINLTNRKKDANLILS